METKQLYLNVNGQRVEVSEEVYRAYIRPVRLERKKQQRWAKKFTTASLESMGENGLEIEDGSLSVDEALITQETQIAELNALQNALLKLKERDRQVIQLFYYEKKTQVEIAELLGVSQQVVSYRLSAALERLKKIFEKIS